MASEGDNDLASLLRAAGVRVQGHEQISPEVRAAVEAEWQATRAARARRRKRIALTTLAVVLVGGLAAWLARPLYLHSSEPIASPSNFKGTVDYRRENGDGWAPLPERTHLESADDVRTGHGSRIELKLVNGVTLVLDADTRVTIDDVHHVVLRRGAVFVDTGPVTENNPRKLRLKTPVGVITHKGAQFEARIVADELHVSVRSGQVFVGLPDGSVPGSGGEKLSIEDTQVTRRPLAAGDGTFDWLTR
jgi:ferric-dicitrate binding protein FerR (iron transport regulator)